MKAAILTSSFLLFTFLQVSSQVTQSTTSHGTTNRVVGSTKATNTGKTVSKPISSGTQSVRPQPTSSQTISAHGTSVSNNTTTTKSPFVSGIHAADGAGKKFNSADASNTANTSVGVTVRGGNDTTFNANTVSRGAGVTTNSGAEDRSGQAQFGQTNWGRSVRNTVGESQWTVPPPITSSFNKEFPSVNNATWSRNNVDTSVYAARYQSGANWVTSTYNASGQRLDTRTEIPLLQAPQAVSVFMAKQPSGFRIATISRLQVQGRPDVYEIKTTTGKTLYVNTDGMEVNL